MILFPEDEANREAGTRTTATISCSKWQLARVMNLANDCLFNNDGLARKHNCCRPASQVESNFCYFQSDATVYDVDVFLGSQFSRGDGRKIPLSRIRRLP